MLNEFHGDTSVQRESGVHELSTCVNFIVGLLFLKTVLLAVMCRISICNFFCNLLGSERHFFSNLLRRNKSSKARW